MERFFQHTHCTMHTADVLYQQFHLNNGSMLVQSLFSFENENNEVSVYERRRESDDKIIDHCIESVVIEFVLSVGFLFSFFFCRHLSV